MDHILLKLAAVNGTVYVYEDKVIIRRTGLYSLAAGKENVIPFSTINSVKFMEGNTVTKGHIKFLVKGFAENSGISFGSVSDCDRYAVLFGKKLNREAIAVKEFVEGKLSSFYTPVQIVASNSPADELKKFKDLLDTGVISEDEFEAKKRQLLDI